MENGPFKDVFPIEHGDIPASYVSLPDGILQYMLLTLKHWKCHYIKIYKVVLQAVGASDPSAGTARPRRRSWHSTCGPQPFHWPYRCYRLVACPIPTNSCVISRELHPYWKNCFKEFKNGWLECLPFFFLLDVFTSKEGLPLIMLMKIPSAPHCIWWAWWVI